MGCGSSVLAQAADLDRRLVQEGKLKISPKGQLSRRSPIASRSSRPERDSRSEPSPPPPSPPPQRAERDSRSERSERDPSDAGIALGLDLAERNDYTSLGYTEAHFAEADLPLHLRLALTRSRPATSGMSSGSLSRTAPSGGSSSPRSPQLSEGSRERRLRRLSFGQDLSERSRSGGLSTALSETARRDAAREARVPEQAPRHVTALVCVGALRRTHTWAIWDHTFPLMMRPSPASLAAPHIIACGRSAPWPSHTPLYFCFP